MGRIWLPSEKGTQLTEAEGEALFALFRSAVSKTISLTDVLTVEGTGRYMVLPNTGTADQITSIVVTQEAVEGCLIQIRPQTATHTITVVHGGGLHLANLQNQVLPSPRSTIWLRHYGGNVWAQEGTVTFTD